MTRDLAADREKLQAVLGAAVAREHAQAAVLARAALDDGVQHPLLYNVVALQLEQEGRTQEAEAMLRLGLAIAPGDPALRNALGLCLMRLQRPAEALVQFESLLSLEDTMPFLPASRGNALMGLGRLRDAEASYRRALELDPGQGVALAGLADLNASRGAYAAARSWAEQALAILPDYPTAVLSLAKAEIGERQPRQAEARVRRLLSTARLDPHTRAYANGVLGDALDAQGRPDEAFDAYSLCNRELREIHASRFAGQVSALAYVESMVRYFERTAAQWQSRMARKSPPDGAARHVFLLGFPRSGTTLLEVILEGHPEVASLEERELLIDGVTQYMQSPEDLGRLLQASPETLEGLRASYWRLAAQAYAEEAGGTLAGKLFIDKHPLNTLKLLLIATLFPDAKILFACRDPRDVVLSCFRHRFRMSAPVYELLSLEGATRYYDGVMRLMVTLSAALPFNICLVRHEDVVTNFAREMARICEFVGLEWVPAMGDFALRTQHRATVTPSTSQLAKGLNTEGIGQWRRYRAALEPMFPMLAPWVERFYYERD